MFGNKEKIKKLEFQIQDLEWRLMNPPKYKVGDVDRKLGKCFEMKFHNSKHFYSIGEWWDNSHCYYEFKFIKGDKILTSHQS